MPASTPLWLTAACAALLLALAGCDAAVLSCVLSKQ